MIIVCIFRLSVACSSGFVPHRWWCQKGVRWDTDAHMPAPCLREYCKSSYWLVYVRLKLLRTFITTARGSCSCVRTSQGKPGRPFPIHLIEDPYMVGCPTFLGSRAIGKFNIHQHLSTHTQGHRVLTCLKMSSASPSQTKRSRW